jgi:hypothetical protein
VLSGHVEIQEKMDFSILVRMRIEAKIWRNQPMDIPEM